jgi:hypothetical protein
MFEEVAECSTNHLLHQDFVALRASGPLILGKKKSICLTSDQKASLDEALSLCDRIF